MKFHNTQVTIPVAGNRCSFGIVKTYSYVETVLAKDHEEAIEKARHSFMKNLEFMVLPAFRCGGTYNVTVFHLSTKIGQGTTKAKIFACVNEAENSDKAKLDAYFALKKILNVKAVGWLTNQSYNVQDLDPTLPDEKDRKIQVGRLAIFQGSEARTRELAVITYVHHDHDGNIDFIKGAYILLNPGEEYQPDVQGRNCSKKISLASEFGVRVNINMFENTVTTTCVSTNTVFDTDGEPREWVDAPENVERIESKRCRRICRMTLNHRSQIYTGTPQELLFKQ